MITIPKGFTECEEYRDWAICIKEGRYRAFGVTYSTQSHLSRADCRRTIDVIITNEQIYGPITL